MKRRALKGLKNLDEESKLRDRVIENLEILKEYPIPRLLNLKKLRGYEDTYRIRIGRIRIVYSINWGEGRMIIHFIGPREKAYRGI